jgi:hypothetical protein
MVKVFCQKPGKLLVLGHHRSLGIVAYDHDHKKAGPQNEEQRAPGQKLDQLKRMRRVGSKWGSHTHLHERKGLPDWFILF